MSTLDKPPLVPQKYALLQLHISVLLFGGAGLFAKYITISAGGIVLGRALIAAAFMLLGHLLLGKILILPKQKKDWISFVGLGSVLAVHWVSFYACIKMTTIAIGVLTFSTFPVFTILLMALIDRKVPHCRNILLSIVALGGVALLFTPSELEANNIWGILLGVLAGLTCAILTIYSQRMLESYSSVQVAFYQNGIAGLLLVPLYGLDILENTTGMEYLYLLLLGIVFTAVAHILFINSMEEASPQTASLVASLEPVYGIAFAWLLLNEIPTWSVLLGGILILGVAFVASVSEE
jgi:drug/metabolite transporter (DMT)-like permease